MRILAVDPGRITGFCLYDTKIHAVQSVWQQRTTPKTVWDVLHRAENRHNILIVEPFVFRHVDRERNKIDYFPAELVGVCKLFTELMRWRVELELVLQQGSTIGKTAFWADDNTRVKQLRLYKSTAAPHGMDALRHVLHYVTFTKHDNHWLEKLK